LDPVADRRLTYVAADAAVVPITSRRRNALHVVTVSRPKFDATLGRIKT